MSIFLKKKHRIIGLVVLFFVIVFSVSGIILNHRKLFSAVDVPRSILSKDYQYNNWNNASVRGTLKISNDSILVYGNIGVWLTDSSFSKYKNLNQGFSKGIDNRKISKLHRKNNSIFAATLFGFYHFNSSLSVWQKISLPVEEENIVDISERGDSLFVLTRSNLLLSTDNFHFKIIELLAPAGYENKVSLFKTLWLIHSGEVYGAIGKLIVDAVALVFVFLAITGIVLFIVKRKQKKNVADQDIKRKRALKLKWNYKWHVKFGIITAIILFVATLTGMFLRPPLLIPIAGSKVNKIPYTKLDSPNAWNDLLRRIIYIPERDVFVLSTSDGFYFLDAELNQQAVYCPTQAPASVMGVTVFENLSNDELLVGSFQGLFIWNLRSGLIYDVMKAEPYVPSFNAGPPVGDFKISGYSADYASQLTVFEYSKGAISLFGDKQFPFMPEEVIDDSPMSLWNLALETHTARIFSALIGDFYILIIPLIGLLILFVIVTGSWMKLKSMLLRKKNRILNKNGTK